MVPQAPPHGLKPRQSRAVPIPAQFFQPYATPSAGFGGCCSAAPGRTTHAPLATAAATSAAAVAASGSHSGCPRRERRHLSG